MTSKTISMNWFNDLFSYSFSYLICSSERSYLVLKNYALCSLDVTKNQQKTENKNMRKEDIIKFAVKQDKCR